MILLWVECLQIALCRCMLWTLSLGTRLVSFFLFWWFDAVWEFFCVWLWVWELLLLLLLCCAVLMWGIWGSKCLIYEYERAGTRGGSSPSSREKVGPLTIYPAQIRRVGWIRIHVFCFFGAHSCLCLRLISLLHSHLTFSVLAFSCVYYLNN